MLKNEAVEGTVYGSGKICFSFYKIYEATDNLLMTYVYSMLLPVISYWSEVVSSHIRLTEPVLNIIITCQGNGQAHQQWQFGLAILAYV